MGLFDTFFGGRKKLLDSNASELGITTNTHEALAELFDTVPTDIVAYFDQIATGSLSGNDKLELNLLLVADAVRWTKEFREFHPVATVLRGVILDDPNTSNHHMYLSAEPCSGRVFYLSHDGDSFIAFPSLAAYLDAAHKALETRVNLRSFHPAIGVPLSNQRGLSQMISDILDGRIAGGEAEVILALVPSMDLTDLALLARLAKDKDFYIAQAVGDAIAKCPRRELLAVAENCRHHPHSQAANAGARAVAAIVAL
jgi:hypothetical protein